VSEYKIGDRVRITRTWEGVAKEIVGGTILLDSGRRPLVDDDNVTVEVLEPEYENGVLYVDAVGAFYVYWPGVGSLKRPWFEPGNENALRAFVPVRPLRKLVPEGE
jgi:hypothetical protein